MKLSKREIVMLSVLLIVAILFVEYRLIIVPGLNRVTALMSTNEQLEAQVDEINLNLASIDNLKKKRDSNLAEIETLSKPFINGLKSDVLLLFTQDLLAQNNLLVSSFGLAPVEIAALTPEAINVLNLTYELADLADQYRALQNAGTETPGPKTNMADPNDAAGQVELFSVQVTAVCSYEQLFTMIDQIQKMERTISIANLSVSYFSPTEINVSMTLQFVGIKKLNEQDDPLIVWTKPALVPSEGNPYGNLTEATTPGTEPTPTETQQP